MSIPTKSITQPQSEKVSHNNWLYGPLGGAAFCVELAFAYAIVFIIYAIVRSSLVLMTVNSDAGFLGTFIAYAVSFVIATLTITALMAIPVAIVGMMTALILKPLLSTFNPRHAPRRAILVGGMTCFVITVILHLMFQRALGFALSDVTANLETYLLWLGIPSVIYIAAGGVASWQLNRSYLVKGEHNV